MGSTQSTSINVNASDTNLRSAGGADEIVRTQIVSRETETVSTSSCTEVDSTSSQTVVKQHCHLQRELCIKTEVCEDKHQHELQRLPASEVKRLVQKGSGISIASTFDSCDEQPALPKRKSEQKREPYTVVLSVSEAEEAFETTDSQEDETTVTEGTYVTAEITEETTEDQETTEEQETEEENVRRSTSKVPVLHITPSSSVIVGPPKLVCSDANVKPIVVIEDEQESEQESEESDTSEESGKSEETNESDEKQVSSETRISSNEESKKIEVVYEKFPPKTRLSYRSEEVKTSATCLLDSSNNKPCSRGSPKISAKSDSVVELHSNKHNCTCDETRKLLQSKLTCYCSSKPVTPCPCKYPKTSQRGTCTCGAKTAERSPHISPRTSPKVTPQTRGSTVTCYCSPNSNAPCICLLKSSESVTANKKSSEIQKTNICICHKEKDKCICSPKRSPAKLCFSIPTPAVKCTSDKAVEACICEKISRKTTQTEQTNASETKVCVKSRVKCLTEHLSKIGAKRNCADSRLIKIYDINKKNNSPCQSPCPPPRCVTPKKPTTCVCCNAKDGCTCNTKKVADIPASSSLRRSSNTTCIRCKRKPDICICDIKLPRIATNVEKIHEKLSKCITRERRSPRAFCEKSTSRRSSAKKTKNNIEPVDIISTIVSKLPKYDCPKPVVLDVEIYPSMNHPNGLKPNQHKVVVKSYGPNSCDKYCENKPSGDIHSRLPRFSSDVDRRQFRKCCSEETDDWDAYYEPEKNKEAHMRHRLSPRVAAQSYLPSRSSNRSQECNCNCNCCCSVKGKRPEIINRTLQNGSQTTPSLYESRGASPIGCNCCKCRSSSPARFRLPNCSPVHMDRSTNTSQNNLYRVKHCARTESTGNCKFGCSCNKYCPPAPPHYEPPHSPRYNPYCHNDYDPPNQTQVCNCKYCLRSDRSGMRPRDLDKLPYEKHQKYGELVNELQHELGSRNATNHGRKMDDEHSERGRHKCHANETTMWGKDDFCRSECALYKDRNAERKCCGSGEYDHHTIERGRVEKNISKFNQNQDCWTLSK